MLCLHNKLWCRDIFDWLLHINNNSYVPWLSRRHILSICWHANGMLRLLVGLLLRLLHDRWLYQHTRHHLRSM